MSDTAPKFTPAKAAADPAPPPPHSDLLLAIENLAAAVRHMAEPMPAQAHAGHLAVTALSLIAKLRGNG